MAVPLKTGLPPDCVLSAGYTVRLLATDATTGATVAGVTLTDISFFVTDLIANVVADDAAPLPLLVPTDEGG